MKKLTVLLSGIGSTAIRYLPNTGKLSSGMRGILDQMCQLKTSIKSGLQAENDEYDRKLKLEIYTLWNMNVLDTQQIADELMISEAKVYNTIAGMLDAKKTDRQSE